MNDSIDTAGVARAGTEVGVARAGAGTRTSGRPLQPRAQVTKDAIVEAAAAHFDRVGYAAASINDIVAGSGSTKGAMYFHFPSKKALAQRLVQGWGTVLSDTITRVTAADEPACRQVAALYRELANRLAHDRQVRAGLMLSLEPAVDESARVYTMWASAVTVIVERAAKAGELGAACAPPRLGASLCAGFVGVVQVATSVGEPETIGERVEDLLALWHGSNCQETADTTSTAVGGAGLTDQRR